jgi:Iodothyronine deiodinase
MRRFIVALWLFFLSGGILAFFWYNEWIYTLPTPVPSNYKPVTMGQKINLPMVLLSADDKPVFLHFFNPDCPCSKFNIRHFQSLVRNYDNRVDFAIVVMSKKHFSIGEIQSKFDLPISVIFDTSLAARCGVYSTPQAVILDKNKGLFYRGNYNRSRYCTDEKSNYAQMALEGLLHNYTNLIFDQLALRAYGCRLPNCTQ